ncbi:type II toxin-antitoxin system RelE family toxin [Cohnella fermenti]|uniref:type II toxin-antitoxin system RelE family toxin n=1 Tax=Cohnella fermenti TaxID=2565925 RepID=UPI001454D802|nr:type II toxin-antitoxin system RelE/ParE family toxin [Cohnella fermenti]
MTSTYKVKFTKEAFKALQKLTSKRQQQVGSIVEQLARNPFIVPDVKPLQGTLNDDYRVRIGSLRLIYRIEQNELIITVLHLGSRGDVYK